MALEPQLERSADRSAPAAGPLESARLLGLDQRALAQAPVATVVIGLDGRVLSWNQAATNLLGWEAEEAVGQWVPFLPSTHATDARHALDRLLAGGDVTDVAFSPLHRDGERRHVIASASLLCDDQNEPSAVLVFLMDVTASQEAAMTVAATERKWRLMLQNISDTVTILDAEARVVETSGEFTEVLGYDGDEWQGADALDLIHPDDRPRAAQLFAEVLAESGAERRAQLRTRHADGHYEIVEYTAVNVLDDDSVGGIVLTTRNVTEMAQAEHLLFGEARILEMIARDAPLDETLPAVAAMVEDHTGGRAAVLVVDATGRRVELRGRGPTLTDRLAETAAAVPLSWLDERYRADPDRAVHRVPDLEAAEAGPQVSLLRQLLLDEGVRSVFVVPVIDRRSEVLYGILVWYGDRPHDLTGHEEKAASVAGHLAAIAIERSRFQVELEHAARHDPLTGLPNRSAVLEHVDAALSRADAADGAGAVAVLFIDLDRFKVVNDAVGHADADRVIARFGTRLASLLRPGDVVGRFAADEFVAVLEDVEGTADAVAVARRVEQALHEPFALSDGEVFVSASIGISLSTPAGETTEVLVQQAAAALHRAKDRGRSRTEVFDGDLRAQVIEQAGIERDLRRAVDRGELAVHYQPKVDLRTGRIVGAEALLRWHHPERGLVLPGTFVAIAEENGLIRRIGRWVLEEALAEAAGWPDGGSPESGLSVSVNLSARQLLSRDLVGQVAQALDASGLPPQRLMLELTETVLIDDRDVAFDVLGELKRLGVRLAIDDFGTGYSSLNYLHRFPVDVVKVDRAFVTGLGADGEGSPITAAVLTVADALGLTTCAEGVERPEQLAGLRALGCDLAQGFWFSEAVPADQLRALLAADPTW